MALQTSGVITLDDMHVEAGGSSGTYCTINDTDIRDLISKASGASMSFNEWYGASAGTQFSFTATTETGNDGSYDEVGIGINQWGGPVQYPGTVMGSSPSITNWDSTGALITGLRIRSIQWRHYPAAGTPSLYVYFDTTTTGDSFIAGTHLPNCEIQITDGTYTTEWIPLGKSVRDAISTSTSFSNAAQNNSTASYVQVRYLKETTFTTTPLWPCSDSNAANRSHALCQPVTSSGTDWTVTFRNN